jgi:hypothetical protein
MHTDPQAVSGIGIISVGLLVLALYVARLAWFASVSRRWPTAPGRMLFSGIQPGRGGLPSNTYVHYSYVVAGVTYESKRLRFGLFPSAGFQIPVSELSALQGKGRLQVYYDPKKPARSCLLTGVNELTFKLPFLLLILSVLFLAVDIFISAS